MARKDNGRNIFLLGALIGVLGGVLLGTLATVELGDKVGNLAEALARKVWRRRPRVRFELLGQ